jgi:hypothetical protein
MTSCLMHRPGDAEADPSVRIPVRGRRNYTQGRPYNDFEIFVTSIDNGTRGDGVWDIKAIIWDDRGEVFFRHTGSYNPINETGHLSPSIDLGR